MQQMSMMLQQQMLVQQVINDLSDRSYEKCITSKPTETLNGTQVACVKATVNKCWTRISSSRGGSKRRPSSSSKGVG